jgi:hypothetical protein
MRQRSLFSGIAPSSDRACGIGHSTASGTGLTTSVQSAPGSAQTLVRLDARHSTNWWMTAQSARRARVRRPLARLRHRPVVGSLPHSLSTKPATCDSGFLSLSISTGRRHGGGMRTQTRSWKIRLPAAPDFCWPVQIRVRAMLTPTAPRISPDLPAGSDVSVQATEDLLQGEAIEAGSATTSPNAVDWRVSGDQEEGTEQ